jgi:starvation-inducible DNA-binding protein
MKIEFTRNDLPETIRRAAIALLNRQLADALDLGLQAKQAHWNVKGPQFSSLHELFDRTAESVEEFTDVIAERAVQLGGIAEGTVQAIAGNSRLPEYELDLYRGSDHLRALSRSLARFAASAREAIATASLAGDADTADVFTQVSRATDTLLWKVAAHIPEAWELPGEAPSAAVVQIAPQSPSARQRKAR